MGSDVPEGGRIGLRIAERLASVVVDVLVVNEDRTRVTIPSTSQTINPRHSWLGREGGEQ